jgi:hypothetical protein
MSFAAAARLAAVAVELKYSAPLGGYGLECCARDRPLHLSKVFRTFPRILAWKVCLTQTFSDIFMLFMFRFAVVYVMQVRSVLGNRPHITTNLAIVACLVTTVIVCCIFTVYNSFKKNSGVIVGATVLGSGCRRHIRD